MKRWWQKLLVIGMAMTMTVTAWGQNAQAAVYKGIPITYGGKTYDYVKRQVTVKVNKKEISTKTKGYVLDNTAMLPANATFKAALKVKYSYTSKTKTLVLSNSKHTVKFVLNQKYAYVDNKKKTLPIPAYNLQNKKDNTSKIMVPGEFTAKSLGYSYQWDSTNATSLITDHTSASGSVSKPVYQGKPISYGGKTYDYVKKSVTTKVDGSAVTSSVDGVILDNVAMVPARATYQNSLEVDYNYDSDTKMLILSNDEHSIEFTLGENYAYVDGTRTKLTVPAWSVKDVESGSSCIMVPGQFTSTNLGYVYEWINTGAIASITTPLIEEDPDDNDSQNPGESTEQDPGESTEQNPGESTEQNPGESTEQDPEEGTEQEPEIDDYSVMIAKPDGISTDEYTENDDYFNKRYILTIPGDQTAFYKKNPVDNSLKKAKSVTVAADDEGNTKITLNTSSIRAFQLTETDSAYYIKIAAPKEIYDKILVLDAGHGGSDPGCMYNGVTEKNATLSIVNAAKNYFDQDGSIKVYYTREDDVRNGLTAGSSGVANSTASLPMRYNFANSVGADMFISIHINSVESSSAKGTEIYYSSNNKNTNDGGLTSSKLASIIKPKIVSVVKSTDRGVKTANFAVIRYTNMPAVLVETAFSSNASDAAVLKSPAKIKELGKAVFDSVVSAFNSYPTDR